MKLKNNSAQIFVPDGTDEKGALARTTALCIAAHQDDIEIMCYHAISECFEQDDKWFCGVTVTDGAGSPRANIYEKYSDEDMMAVRAKEQKSAALIGKYSAQFLLAYRSSEVKAKNNSDLVKELYDIIIACSPDVIYTHNLADKHDTHVAVALRTIQAIKMIPKDKRPKKVYSLEVWRSLDWLCDEDKAVFDTSRYPNLGSSLIGLYDSQITGGKRYDKAAIGRRIANATFFASHEVDDVESASFGLDITSLVNDDSLTPEKFISVYLDKFKEEVISRIIKL